MHLSKLKYIIRLLSRYNLFAYVNIAGLSISLCAISIIYIFISSEIQKDSHFSDSKDIYRLVRQVDEINSSYASPSVMGPFREIMDLESNIPASRIVRVFLSDELVIREDKSFFEPHVMYVDQNFFEILDFPFKYGNPETALQEKASCVISERIAAKYFGDENPIGGILEIEGNQKIVVRGVIDQRMAKSHLNIDFLINNGALEKRFLENKQFHSFAFYLKIPEQEVKNAKYQLDLLAKKYFHEPEDASTTTIRLQPLSAIYFDDTMIHDDADHGNASLIRTLTIIGIVLFFIMISNFVNLTIARIAGRTKQIGLRKLLGSSNRSLQLDWFLEVYTVILLATLLAFFGASLLIPVLETSFEFQVSLPARMTVIFWLVAIPVLATALIIAIPSAIFSRIKSFSALSGKLGSIRTNAFQNAILFFQFSVTLVLVVFTIVVHKQFVFMQEKEIGIDVDQVLMFNSNNKKSWRNRNKILQEARQVGGVKDVTMLYGGIPDSPSETISYTVDNATYQWNTAYALPNVTDVLSLIVLEGKAFDPQIRTEAENSVLINESAANALGWPEEDLLGKKVEVEDQDTSMKIAGIFRDYHYDSFRKKIEPLVIRFSDWGETFVVKLRGREYQTVLSGLEGIWQKYVPGYPFSHRFLDDSFQKMHVEDTRNRKIIFLFTVLTILITSMGTLSMVAFIQESKVKEVTIRKVLGSSIADTLLLISSIFFKVLLAASAVSIPVIWFVSSQWLNGFSYRIQMSPFYYMVGFLTVGSVMLILILVQAWNTITLNPAERLRNE